MLVVLGLLPLWSLTAITPPWTLWGTGARAGAVLAALAFWIGPWLVCGLIGARSFLLVPFFWLECLALIGYSLQDTQGMPAGLQLLRFLLLGMMALCGTLLLRKDMILPLLSRRRRGWRRAPRFELNHRAQVLGEGPGSQVVNAMIENCSATGMAISAADRDLRPMLRTKTKGDELGILLRCGKETFEIRAALVWIETRDPLVRIGVAVRDPALFGRLLLRLGQPAKDVAAEDRLARLWASNALRVTLVTLWASSVGASLAVPACGRLDGEGTLHAAATASGGAKDGRRQPRPAPRPAADEVSAPNDRAGLGLTLANTTAYQIAIDGCKSGYTTTQTEASQTLQLYLGDYGCLGRLLQFTYEGQTFTPDPAHPFHTLLSGDTAVFLSPDRSIQMGVTVTSQLGSPLQGTDAVDFQFDQAPVASSQRPQILGIIPGAVGTANSSKRKPTPDFAFFSGQVVNEQPSQNTVQWVFTLQCSTPLSNTTVPVNTSCNGLILKSLTYALVKDTFNGVPCTRATTSGCRSLMPAAPPAVNPATDIILPGTGGMANGGFTTKIDLAQALIGPANMAANPKMTLLLSDGLNDFQYFDLAINVKVAMYLEGGDDPPPAEDP